jgi:hypothetical protein
MTPEKRGRSANPAERLGLCVEPVFAYPSKSFSFGTADWIAATDPAIRAVRLNYPSRAKPVAARLIFFRPPVEDPSNSDGKDHGKTHIPLSPSRQTPCKDCGFD